MHRAAFLFALSPPLLRANQVKPGEVSARIEPPQQVRMLCRRRRLPGQSDEDFLGDVLRARSAARQLS